MISPAWGVCGLILGIVCREAFGADDAAAVQNSPNLPFWGIILICLACILVMALLTCLICTICAVVRPQLYPQQCWVRSYFPHLAFWGYDVDPNDNV